MNIELVLIKELKIGRIFDKKFGKSLSFLLYLKCRQFVFEIFEHQIDQIRFNCKPDEANSSTFCFKKISGCF